jgi:phosphoglycolate phosphatase
MIRSMALKAVLFDLDGTLLDSLEDLGEAVNRTLRELGFPVHEAAEYRQFIGEGAKKLVERALPEPARDDGEVVERALALYQRHYEACWHERTRVFPGLSELVSDLGARGLRLGVISNKPHRFTQLCVGHFFPAAGFEVILGQRDGVARKPDPAAGLEAARSLGLAPGECVYVGDSGVDMQFAKAAGMGAVGVLWGFRDERELRENGADVLICDVKGLKARLLSGYEG